ncbi:UDP-D-galactose:(glucosyl)lipopolysaccharide-1,6-D-galactosyltransferase [compost metagenome]
MRILIVSPYYKPGYKAGGPIQSTYNLSKLLENKIEIFVFTQSNDFGENVIYNNIEENKWCELDNHKVYYCSEKKFNIKTLKNIIDNVNPELIYLNSLFHSLSWKAIITNKIRKLGPEIIIAPRGELDPGALKLKSLKKSIFIKIIKYFIKKNIVFHATTIEEKPNIARFFSNKIRVAENVPNLILEKPVKEIKYKNKTNLVFISRISPKKNLSYCIDVLNKINVEGQINFDIIGPLEDKVYWNNIQKGISNLNKNIILNYIGQVPNHELITETTKYHYLFFPTKAENYGHIIYEALSYGIPVILSDQTPWREENNGVFVRSLDNINKFVNLIEDLHKIDNDEFSVLSTKAYEFAKNKVNIEEIKESYKNLFNATNTK